jgi:hypothetical protein
MTTRTLVLTTLLLAAATAVQAQPAAPRTPPPPAAPQAPAAPRAATPPAAPTPAAAPSAPQAPVVAVAPRRSGQPINIKIELTITDQRGGTAPLRKTVTLVTGDGLNGSLRSTAIFSGMADLPLNVDAEPSILADGKVRLGFTLQYDLPSQVAQENPSAPSLLGRPYQLQRTNIRESVNVILDSGKAITVAQSADPISDRQVTVEVMATVLK